MNPTPNQLKERKEKVIRSKEESAEYIKDKIFRCKECREYKLGIKFNLTTKRPGYWHRRSPCKDCQLIKDKSRKPYFRDYARKYVESELGLKKTKARILARKALRDGDIVKLNYCESCGSNQNLEMHHMDYNKPKEVVWLCKKCHHLEDIKIKT